MAKKDPKFVRITDPLRRPGLYDVQASGWSITGKDVKEFPEDEAAQKFVRRQIRDGNIEPCSRAEYEEVQASNAATAGASKLGHQEHKLWESVKGAQTSESSDNVDDDDDSDGDSDTEDDDPDDNDDDSEPSEEELAAEAEAKAAAIAAEEERKAKKAKSATKKAAAKKPSKKK